MSPMKLILVNSLSPGDITVMTAALEMLHEQHRGRFITSVDTSCDAIFENNPWVQPKDSSMDGAQHIKMEYPLIHQSNQRPVHFLQGYVEWISSYLSIPLTLTTNRPHIYLSDAEKGWINQVEEITREKTRFWLINSGHKMDYTAKNWGHHHYQQVVDILKDKVLFVQVGQAGKDHKHLSLEGVIDLTGKTDSRQFIRLCWHAVGGLGPSTWLQHVMAAFEKPYCCLLGAREPLSWCHYPNQHTFSTHGQLACDKNRERHGWACWRSRTVPLDTGDPMDGEHNEKKCELPVLSGLEPVPACLEVISPEEVAATVLRFWENRA